MTEEDKNSSPLDEGTEIIAHTAQTAYATTAAVAAGGTAAGMAAGTALAGPLGTVVGALVSNKTVWKILISIFLFCFLWMFTIANMIGIIFRTISGNPRQFNYRDESVELCISAHGNNIIIP